MDIFAISPPTLNTPQCSVMCMSLNSIHNMKSKTWMGLNWWAAKWYFLDTFYAFLLPAFSSFGRHFHSFWEPMVERWRKWGEREGMTCNISSPGSLQPQTLQLHGDCLKPWSLWVPLSLLNLPRMHFSKQKLHKCFLSLLHEKTA